jgi:hypothetical protein
MAATRITTQDLKDSAVTTAKINDGAVTVGKLGALTTKGDLLSFGSAHDRLAVGTNGQYLVADSGETLGIKWATFSGLATTNFVQNETPTGTIDGVNAAFTLANTPTAGTLQLYKNGIRQRAGAGNDFTVATATITFEAGNLPQTGDILLADYMK